MCKETIEAAANKKGMVNSEWNEDSKELKITYDNKKTNPDEILKRVAYAGYDNEKFLAPESAYAKLAGCCKYERANKTAAPQKNPGCYRYSYQVIYKSPEKILPDPGNYLL